MNAKEYLEQARHLDAAINTKIERVAALQSLTERVTAPLDSEVVSRSRNMTSLQDHIIALMEEQEALNAQIDQLVDLKREIAAVLAAIDDREGSLLLEQRYLCFNTWTRIAASLHMSRRTVFNVHDRALQEVDGILGSDAYEQIRKRVLAERKIKQ